MLGQGFTGSVEVLRDTAVRKQDSRQALASHTDLGADGERVRQRDGEYGKGEMQATREDSIRNALMMLEKGQQARVQTMS